MTTPTDPSRPIDEEIAEVLALADKAMKGPWTRESVLSGHLHDIALGYDIPGEGRPILIAMCFGDDEEGRHPTPEEASHNAAFIAAAPRMAALIRRMAEERKEVIDTLQFYAGASRNTYALEGGQRALELMVKMLVHDDGDGPPEAQPQQQEKP